MFDKNWKRIAASEINPELYIKRRRKIRNERIKEAFGMVGTFIVGGFLFALWLAYEGWITPDTFKGIL